ncbi:MAG: hydroxymethylbilane synthase [Rhodobacteraceae bacterium]|nr:hydroxymethylbilane synthase [Paracoccaceae bacterium]
MPAGNPSPAQPLKIGTRRSPLALAQAQEVRQHLQQAHDLPPEAFKIMPMHTEGDDRRMIATDQPLKTLGNKGLFTRRIEHALLRGTIDIAVHSTKDMPIEQPAGLVLDVFLPRGDVRDAFVSPRVPRLADLPWGAVVGTSSLRRRAQILHMRPDVQVVDFRGNVQTRLRKLHDGVAQGSFLAMAGLQRLGLGGRVGTAIEPDEMLPAIAQGVIGIERRTGDHRLGAFLAHIDDAATATQIRAERALLAGLDGSCETPVAGLATLDGNNLRLRGEILRPNGSERLREAMTSPVEDATALGHAMARRLLSRAGSGFFTQGTGST